MPELPEVEVVRRGLAAAIVGRSVTDVTVLHPRPVRAHPDGPTGFVTSLTGRIMEANQALRDYRLLDQDSQAGRFDRQVAELRQGLAAHLGQNQGPAAAQANQTLLDAEAKLAQLKKDAEKPSQPEQPEKPATGDAGVALWLTVMCMTSLLGAALVGKKRKA